MGHPIVDLKPIQKRDWSVFPTSETHGPPENYRVRQHPLLSDATNVFSRKAVWATFRKACNEYFRFRGNRVQSLRTLRFRTWSRNDPPKRGCRLQGKFSTHLRPSTTQILSFSIALGLPIITKEEQGSEDSCGKRTYGKMKVPLRTASRARTSL